MQAYALRSWWQEHEHKWVTFDTPDANSLLEGEDVEYGYFPTTRNVPNLARNTRMARRVLAEYEPEVIFSTGAGIAVPYFLLGRRLGVRTVYLEVIDRIDTATLTGRILHPFTDEFLVQWEEQLELYPDSTVVGLVV